MKTRLKSGKSYFFANKIKTKNSGQNNGAASYVRRFLQDREIASTSARAVDVRTVAFERINAMTITVIVISLFFSTTAKQRPDQPSTNVVLRTPAVFVPALTDCREKSAFPNVEPQFEIAHDEIIGCAPVSIFMRHVFRATKSLLQVPPKHPRTVQSAFFHGYFSF